MSDDLASNADHHGALAPRPRIGPWVILVLLITVAVADLPVLVTEPRADVARWLYIGARVNAGDRPYVDVLDNKFPPLFWVCRLTAAADQTYRALYLAAVASDLLAACLLALLARELVRHRTFWLAGLLYAAFVGMSQIHCMTENYAVPAMAGTILLALRSLDSPRPTLILTAAGVCFGTACLFRPPLALDAAVVAWVLFVMSRGRVTLPWILRTASFALGVAGAVMCVVVSAHVGGYLEEMLDVCVWHNLRYGMSNVANQGGRFTPELRLIVHFALKMGEFFLAHGLAIGGLLVLLVGGRRAPVAGTAAALTLVMWYVLEAVATFPGGAHYTHQHIPWIAAACVCSAVLWAVIDRAPPLTMRLPNLSLATLVGLAALGSLLFHPIVTVIRPETPGPAVYEEMAHEIGDLVGREDTVFFGSSKPLGNLRLRLNRPTNTQHLFAASYIRSWGGSTLLDEWEHDMMSNPPDWIVAPASDSSGEPTFFEPRLQETPQARRFAQAFQEKYRLTWSRHGLCLYKHVGAQ
jgi:hypothetical protein